VRKIVLTTFQFFAFSHSQGQKQSLHKRARYGAESRIPAPDAGTSARQLLDIAWGGLHNLSADLSATGVNDRDGVSRLVIAYAPGARPFLPIGTIRIALDLPCAMPHDPCRRLEEGRAIRGKIDHGLAGRGCFT
jgi:hypothetical protein